MKHFRSQITMALMMIMAVALAAVNAKPATNKPADVKNLVPPEMDTVEWTEYDMKEAKDACGGHVFFESFASRPSGPAAGTIDFRVSDAEVLKPPKCMQLIAKWMKVQTNIGRKVMIEVLIHQKQLLSQTLKQLREHWIDHVDKFALDVSGLQLSNSELGMIVENLLPRASKLKELDLKKNPLTEKGVKLLVPLLHKANNLTLLQLSSTQLKDAGIKELSAASNHMKSLGNIWLDDNGITDNGAKIIADTLIKNCPELGSMSLKKNSITEKGKKILVDAVKFRAKVMRGTFVSVRV